MIVAVRNPERSLAVMCQVPVLLMYVKKNRRNRGGNGTKDVGLGILHSPEEGNKCFQTILKRREKTEC